jgi:hypothetical protein
MVTTTFQFIVVVTPTAESLKHIIQQRSNGHSETADIDYDSSLEEHCSKENDRRPQRLYAILLQVRVGDFEFLTRPARDQ